MNMYFQNTLFICNINKVISIWCMNMCFQIMIFICNINRVIIIIMEVLKHQITKPETLCQNIFCKHVSKKVFYSTFCCKIPTFFCSCSVSIENKRYFQGSQDFKLFPFQKALSIDTRNKLLNKHLELQNLTFWKFLELGYLLAFLYEKTCIFHQGTVLF